MRKPIAPQAPRTIITTSRLVQCVDVARWDTVEIPPGANCVSLECDGEHMYLAFTEITSVENKDYNEELKKYKEECKLYKKKLEEWQASKENKREEKSREKRLKLYEKLKKEFEK